MTFLSKLFARQNPNRVMQPLYDAIVREGRQPAWYEQGNVPDTIDGRFDMIAAILCLVLIRLEEDADTKQQSAWLTEIFVTDMDGQLRQIGIGDMVVGKHIGRMMGALGGRLGAYRDALTSDKDMSDALVRNLYRGDDPDQIALQFVSDTLAGYYTVLRKTEVSAILEGKLPEALQ